MDHNLCTSSHYNHNLFKDLHELIHSTHVSVQVKNQHFFLIMSCLISMRLVVHVVMHVIRYVVMHVIGYVVVHTVMHVVVHVLMHARSLFSVFSFLTLIMMCGLPVKIGSMSLVIVSP